MKIIGITGSSGSGKTTLGMILEKRDDVRVVDADKIVREMSVPGNEYLLAIKETFGKEVFEENDNLNRKSLADKIYNDNIARENLNKLTFKYVVQEILKRIEKLKEENINFIAIDAPLLFESGLDKYCDIVITLVANKSLKIKRICERDNVDEKTAESRLNIQKSDEFYKKNADFVIENNENCDLEKAIERILK